MRPTPGLATTTSRRAIASQGGRSRVDVISVAVAVVSAALSRGIYYDVHAADPEDRMNISSIVQSKLHFPAGRRLVP
jgi:hypothetical protein